MESTVRALHEKAARKEAMQMEENRKRLSARNAHILMVLLPAITVRFFVSSACNADFHIVSYPPMPLCVFLFFFPPMLNAHFVKVHVLMMHDVLDKYDWK